MNTSKRETDQNSLPVSIIIPTNNRFFLLYIQIRLLLMQIRPADEILIVIDPADTITQNKLNRTICTEPNHQLRVFVGKQKHNVSHLRNMGIQQSRRGILVFLDDDCIPTSNFLSDVRERMRKNKLRLVAYQGKILHAPIHSSRYVDYFNSKVDAFSQYKNGRRTQLQGTAEHLLAGNFFLEKSLITKNKIAFNEVDFPLVGEQLDFSYKLQQRGISILELDNAQVIHVKYQFNLRRILVRQFLEGYTEQKLRAQYQTKIDITTIFPNHFRQYKENKHRLFIVRLLQQPHAISLVFVFIIAQSARATGVILSSLELHMRRLLRGRHPS